MLGAENLPRWLSGKESACQHRRSGFNPWVKRILWRRKWQHSPVFLPGESYGQRSLAGYSLWGGKESDTTELLSTSVNRKPKITGSRPGRCLSVSRSRKLRCHRLSGQGTQKPGFCCCARLSFIIGRRQLQLCP